MEVTPVKRVFCLGVLTFILTPVAAADLLAQTPPPNHQRYTGKADDRRAADRAYAEAMREVVTAHPTDDDARTLYAKALMDLRPWNYWTRDGLPYEETRQVQTELGTVFASNRNHPGALHLWLHLWEATDTPERAEAEADRLQPLMPGAGHIVHMPAHIYQRVGRYEDRPRAARRRASRRSGSRLLGGPEAQPRERLVAVRPPRGAEGAEEDRGGGAGRGTAAKGVEERGRDANVHGSVPIVVRVSPDTGCGKP